MALAKAKFRTSKISRLSIAFHQTSFCGCWLEFTKNVLQVKDAFSAGRFVLCNDKHLFKMPYKAYFNTAECFASRLVTNKLTDCLMFSTQVC